MSIPMYGAEHIRGIDESVMVAVNEKLRPFAKALASLNGTGVDRGTAHLNELATQQTPMALALHFRYIGCKPSGGLEWLMALRPNGIYIGDQPFLGMAMAEIVENVAPEKVPAAMLFVRMRLVAMTIRQ